LLVGSFNSLSVEIVSMCRNDSVMARMKYCFSPLQWGYGSVAKSTDLMATTAQIEENYLESLLEELVVPFLAVFTIEAFPLCVLEGAAG
jgi:hypothetical protein